jgi:hypothetical protein
VIHRRVRPSKQVGVGQRADARTLREDAHLCVDVAGEKGDREREKDEHEGVRPCVALRRLSALAAFLHPCSGCRRRRRFRGSLMRSFWRLHIFFCCPCFYFFGSPTHLPLCPFFVVFWSWLFGFEEARMGGVGMGEGGDCDQEKNLVPLSYATLRALRGRGGGRFFDRFISRPFIYPDSLESHITLGFLAD